MADTYTFVALLCAPVPVGHLVELTWFESPSGGFLGPKAQRLAHIRDLDTRVSFGEMGCFEEVSAMRLEPRLLPLELRSDLRVVEQTRGRVVNCQVATMGFSDKFIQTTLVIDPNDSDPASS